MGTEGPTATLPIRQDIAINISWLSVPFYQGVASPPTWTNKVMLVITLMWLGQVEAAKFIGKYNHCQAEPV